MVSANESINYHDYRAANTPVNYSFIHLEYGAKSYEHFDNKSDVLQISGQVLMNESYIFKMGYQAELRDGNLDSKFDDLEVSYQGNLANIGIGWRYPLAKTTDIEVDAHLLYSWINDLDLDDNTLTYDQEQNDTGFSVGATLQQSLGQNIEAQFGLNYTSINSSNESKAEFSITNYFTRYIGIGVNGYIAKQDGDTDDITYSNFDSDYIGVHVNLAFY